MKQGAFRRDLTLRGKMGAKRKTEAKEKNVGCSSSLPLQRRGRETSVYTESRGEEICGKSSTAPRVGLSLGRARGVRASSFGYMQQDMSVTEAAQF